MNFVEELAADLTALNSSLLEDFGTSVAVYRVVQAGRADSTKAKSYAIAIDLAQVNVDVLDPVAAAKKTPFGLTPKAQMVVLLPRVNGALPTININDGFKFLSGPYVQQRFIADNAGAADAQGITLAVSLVLAPSNAVMA